MELRDIEIFLTLAEELHFGRTAARLYVSTARVSQAIKKQERDVGGALFERTSHTVRLTPLGEQLRTELEPAYGAVLQAVHRARLAAHGITSSLRVGMIPDIAFDLRPAWEALRRAVPECRLELSHSSFLDPFATLRNRQIDALIAWLPVEEPDLAVGAVVCTESRVLAVASDDPLAEDDWVSLDRMGDERAVGTAQPHAPEYWEDVYVPFTTPTGRPIDNRVPVETLDEVLRLISLGRIVHPLGGHARRYHARPDIAYLPLRDAPPTTWALISRRDDDNPHIRALNRIFGELGTARFS